MPSTAPQQSRSNPPGRQVLRASWVVPAPGRVLEGGAVVVDRGRIEAVLDAAAAARASTASAEVVELPDCVLTAGTVNAHAHLELGALAGRIPPGGTFEQWVGALLGARAACDRDALERGYRAGAAQLLAAGTTTVADVDSLGLWRSTLGPGAPRRCVQREILDARDPDRRSAAIAMLQEAVPADDGRSEGLSPHAPFSVSDALVAAAAGVARARRLPIAMHWAETPEEIAWIGGEAAWFDRFFPREDGMAGLDLLDRHGLLGPRTSLVHGNHPQPGEIDRIAGSGATVVHCPGSHAYFDRDRFPLADYLRAGVRVALGTDSIASNSALDLRAEMAALRRTDPDLDPAAVWAMATEAGAAALGQPGRSGRLQPGDGADLAVFGPGAPPAGGPASAREVLDWLTGARPPVVATWVAGHSAWQ